MSWMGFVDAFVSSSRGKQRQAVKGAGNDTNLVSKVAVFDLQIDNLLPAEVTMSHRRVSFAEVHHLQATRSRIE